MVTTESAHRLQAHWRLQTMSAGLRVVLADGDDERARAAALRLADWGISPVLITSNPVSGEGVLCLDPREVTSEIREVLSGVVERQSLKRELSAQESDQLVTDPLMVAMACVASGYTDGCVAGATRASAEVARAALRVVGLAPDTKTLSSSFLMLLPDGRALGYGDCAVVPEPDALQLAQIAAATADTYADVVGEEPIVAMLSFSTKGSADHSSVQIVRDATALVRQHRPDLVVDGELQFDAAVVPEIASAKAPASEVAGKANVFIFPNLAAGNIAYKVTERLAGAEAFGPLFQGLAAPVNDLSRGCSSQDILNISVITSVQALRHRNHAAAGGA